MSLIIQYCEKCGERVDPRDIESGAALHYKDESYCKSCKDAILPELEKDPEFKKHQSERKQQRQRQQSSSTTRPDSGLLDLPRQPGGSGRVRRQSAVMQKRSASRRAAGQNHQPSSSGRSAAGGNTMAYVLCGVGGLIALVVLVALLNSGGGDSGESKSKPDKDGKKVVKRDDLQQSDPKKIDLAKKKAPKKQQDNSLVAIQYRKLVKFRKTYPAKHKTFLDQLERYMPEAADTQYARLAMKMKRETLATLNQEAQRAFDEIKKMAKKLAEEGSYQLAINKWDEFSPELLTGQWVARINFEKKQLQEAKRKAEEAKFVRGTIPGGGRNVEIFNGHSLDGWRVGRGNESIWNARSGLLAVDNSGGSRTSFAFCFDKMGGKNYLFKDFYLTFELQVQAGWMRVLGRIPAGQGPKLVKFEAHQTSFEQGRWYRAHFVVIGSKAEWWIEKAVSLQTKSDFTSPEGAAGLEVSAGGRFTARAFKMQVLNQGALAPAPKKAPPVSPESFFNGKDLEGWDTKGKWTVLADGSINIDSSTEDTNVLIRGDDKWRDYTLTLEVRGVTGEFSVFVRVAGGKSSGIRFNEKLFPNKTSWYKMVFTVKGDKVKFEIPLTGTTKTFDARSTQGKVAFVVKKGNNVQLRNLKLTLQK